MPQLHTTLSTKLKPTIHQFRHVLQHVPNQLQPWPIYELPMKLLKKKF